MLKHELITCLHFAESLWQKIALEINVVDEILPQGLTPKNCSCCQHDQKRSYRKENFRKLHAMLLLKQRTLQLSDSISRVSPNLAKAGGVCASISQSASRLLKTIGLQFWKELSAVQFQNGGSRRSWRHRLLRSFERPKRGKYSLIQVDAALNAFFL